MGQGWERKLQDLELVVVREQEQEDETPQLTVGRMLWHMSIVEISPKYGILGEGSMFLILHRKIYAAPSYPSLLHHSTVISTGSLALGESSVLTLMLMADCVSFIPEVLTGGRILRPGASTSTLNPKGDV